MTLPGIILSEISGDYARQARVSPKCGRATRFRKFHQGRRAWRHHTMEVPMRRAFTLLVSGLLFAQLFADDAAARSGGFHGGFAGGGFRGGGFVGGGFRGGGFGRGGFARPAFAGAGFARPGWQGGGVRWGGGWGTRPGWGWRAANVGLRPGWGSNWGWRRGWRPGWGWGAAGAGLAFGALAAAPYFNSFDYDDCPVVGRRVWSEFGPRVIWVNSCDYY
jgi:hypothetical protein